MFDVSVMSLAHNRRENVRELLTALRCQTYPSFETIVIDNASSDKTAGMVSNEFPEVNLIENRKNLGVSAYNLGFAQAKGKYILMMDDDGLPGSHNWIAEMVKCFETNPQIGIISCTIRMRDTGRIAHDSPQFVPNGNAQNGYPGVAYNGTGAGIRTEALRAVGYYPTYFHLTYLELHLCTRFLDAGWEVRHFPHLEVWHSRPSETTFRAGMYYGLRNYYWYVWEQYPLQSILYETIHRTGYHLKLGKKGQATWRNMFKASAAAMFGIHKPLSRRNPISEETLAYLRWVRRYGNWHNIAPEIVPFDKGVLVQEREKTN